MIGDERTCSNDDCDTEEFEEREHKGDATLVCPECGQIKVRQAGMDPAEPVS